MKNPKINSKFKVKKNQILPDKYKYNRKNETGNYFYVDFGVMFAVVYFIS